MKKNEKSKSEERMKGLSSYLRVNGFILNDTDFSEQVQFFIHLYLKFVIFANIH